MAFTTAAKNSLAQMLGWTRPAIDEHLAFHAVVIDAETEAAVLELVENFADLPADDGVEIFPNAANYGLRKKNNRETARGQILESLYPLLNITRPNDLEIVLERG